ncbi:bucentaur or craniofacial development-domain-containing protein, partial [Microdochium bolleyi]
MTPDPMLLDAEDDDYASDQDSDFAPDAPGAANQDDDDASSSDDEDENNNEATSAVAGSKRDATGLPTASKTAAAQNKNDDDDDEGFENSGDEAIIQRAHRKKRKKSRKHGGGGGDGEGEEDGEDEGGEGGLVKTRAMRAAEKAERRDRGVVPAGPVTVDVDDLWARMTAGPVMPGKNSALEDEQDAKDAAGGAGGDKENQEPGPAHDDGDDDLQAASDAKTKSSSGGNKTKKDGDAPATIKIKRTYNFAGKVHTEEKLVARDSAEAKLYIASLDPKSAEYLALTTASGEGNTTDADADAEAQLRRPRKAFRSIFEPVVADPTALQRADLNLGLSAALQQREASFRDGSGKAKKLNVVEKSRMDWAGFVDKEGIKDELELAGRSKESYAHRQDFLSRVEANRDDE